MKKPVSSSSIFSVQERRLLRTLSSPYKIQEYLDSIEYSDEIRYRSPRTVLRNSKAHCYDGAVFAAAALKLIGYEPLLIELLPNDNDDDHIIAPFKRFGNWGAIAKSNFVGLRYREPVYRNIRELVMSYFESYFNVKRERTLRGYTAPLNLSRFNSLQWIINDSALDAIADALDCQRRFSIISRQCIKNLAIVDQRSYTAGLLGAKISGLYKPQKG